MLAGCSPAPAWSPVQLPAGMRPAALAPAGDTVVVAGRGGDQPMLVQVSGTSVARELPTNPNDPDASDATLVSVTASGDALHAVGEVYGGAHSNPRLTVWDGSLSAGLVTSRPQEFFTFGGHDAGPLLGTLVIDQQPVIFGIRTTTAGIEGVLWTLRGTTWHKRTGVDPLLGSNPDREVGFTAITTLGSRILVVGDEVGLAGGLRQQPMLWVGSITGGWQQLALPLPPDLPAVARQLSRATGVACPPAGTSCWAAGWVRGHPIVWPVTLSPGGQLETGTPVVLPGEPAVGADPIALVTIVGDHPVVLTNAASPTLQLGCPDGWRALAAPSGRASGLVSAGDSVYSLFGNEEIAQISRLDAPRC